MKVTIQTTHELETVPKKVAGIVDEAAESLEKLVLPDLDECSGMLKYSKDMSDISKVFDKITKTKENFIQAAETLDDCLQILLGYGKVINQLSQEANKQSNTVEPTVDQILEEIEAAEEEVADEGH